MFVCGIVGVYAATYFPSNDVTYDNKESGLVSTNVQGAIDELYGKAQQCSNGKVNDAVENIKIVISGDGLYKDPYEDRYFYKGKNPNNYITFNNETAGWRIISFEPDGTIKIMKINSLKNELWDSNDNKWFRPSSLNTYLNTNYYNSLNAVAKNQVVSHDFNIGSVKNNNDCLTDNVNSEKDMIWNGKIGLATVSEYLRTNSNIDNCRTVTLINNNSACKDTTWMFNGNNWWTISRRADSNSYVYAVNNAGGFFYDSDAYYANYAVRPVLYLNSNIKLSGSGTSQDPYIIE